MPSWTLPPRTLPWYAVRLVVTCMVAGIIASFFGEEGALAWILVWPGLFWLWKYWDRRRGETFPSAAGTQPSVGPTSRGSSTAIPRPRLSWRRILRNAALTIVGLVVFFVVLVVYPLHYSQKQAEAARDKVHVGMMADEVLPAVRGWFGLRAHAVLPENAKDDDGSHYVSLSLDSDGKYHGSVPPNSDLRELSESEAAALLRQKMSDGHEWIWRYTFLNRTPQRFSFSVTFRPDGRVKEVTPVWGWD